MRLLITRPLEDARPLAAELERLGHWTLLEPLLQIEPLPESPLDLTDVQAILITSANGLRALATRTERRELPVLAVGDSSARAARDIGFAQVASASGDVADLADLASARLDPLAGPLLHVAGTRVAGDLSGLLERKGFSYRRATLYRARRAERLSDACADAFLTGGIDGVLFFSPRTAATFVSLITARDLSGSLRRVAALCLSPAVAEEARRVPWRRLLTAARPDQAALLACLGDLEAELDK